MTPKLPSAVLYVNERGVQLATEGMPVVASTDYLPTVFRDMEIQDRVGFKALMEDFILKSRIPAVEIIIVISDKVYFDQEIKAADRTQAEALAQKYLETIPLQSVSMRVYQTGAIFWAVVINKDLVDTLDELFKSHGCFISGVYPTFAFPQITAKSSFTPELARSIIKSVGSVRQLSFYSPTPTPRPTLKPSANAEERKKEFILISIFLLLLLILVAIVILKPFK